MRKRNASEQRIYFPWERGGGLLRRFGLHRLGPFVVAAATAALLAVFGMGERRDAGIRQTRVTLMEVRTALDAYVAHHEGACPPALEAIADYGPMEGAPRDAWGKPLRFACPGRWEGERYEVWSDGPDGRSGGLDRIE